MEHPYRHLPASAFWRKSVVGTPQEVFDPVTPPPWRIGPQDPVVTAGSCFAQHISKALAASGFNYLVTETPGPEEADTPVIYSARYGNIYTTMQLRQLLERAYHLRKPHDKGWVRPDGRYVDPFRPREFAAGFADAAAVAAAQKRHYAAVREAMESCKVLVFTLGLTESWVGDADGMAVPLAPNVVAGPAGGAAYRFKNLAVEEMVADLEAALGLLWDVNPGARVVLTVSPVPLEATYEPRHVLVSTAYSKAALRVTAETVQRRHLARVAYFPSYEMVASFPHAQSFEADLRTVRPDLVAHIMRTFRKHFTQTEAEAKSAAPRAPAPASSILEPVRPAIRDFDGVVCDEEMLGKV